MPAPVPEVLAAWMRPFRGFFTTAVWRHALVLVAGGMLFFRRTEKVFADLV